MPTSPDTRPPGPPAPPAGPVEPGSPYARLRAVGQRVGAGIRVVFALGLVLRWGILALAAVVPTWGQAAQVPAATGGTFDAQRAPPGDAPLYTLLVAAHTQCPATPALLVLSDDERARQRGQYFLYPQRLDVILSTDPLDPATITAHAGGCVFYYGPQGTRLDPFLDRLTPLACSADGCLLAISK